MMLLITSCDVKRKFSKLSINEKKKILISHPERLHKLSILFTDNEMTKSSSYEEIIWEDVVKNIEKAL